jgi:hypothetical protein
MVNWLLTQVPRIYTGERTRSSVEGMGTWSPFFTLCTKSAENNTDLNVRSEGIKILEEKEGKTKC